MSNVVKMNEKPEDDGEQAVGAPRRFTKKLFKDFIQRIESLEEEKQKTSDDIKEVYMEAKGSGFDTKIMKMVIRIRKMDKASYQEEQAILELYLSAIGL